MNQTNQWFVRMINTGMNLRGSGEKLLPNRRTAEVARSEWETHKQLESRIVALGKLSSKVFALTGSAPRLYCGDHNPIVGIGRSSHYDLISGWAFAVLSKEGQAYVTGKEGRNSAIVAIGSPMSNKEICYTQGCDLEDPFRRRVRAPLTGETLLVEFEGFHTQESEKVRAYSMGNQIEEFRWGIIDIKKSASAGGEVVAQPDIYRQGDATDELDVGFLKNDDLLITVILRHGGPPIIFLGGNHGPAAGSLPFVLSNERLLKELLRHRPEHGSFQAHIHITTVLPDHERKLLRVPDNALELVSIEPLGETAEELLACFSDHRISSIPRVITIDNLLKQALFAKGISPDDLHEVIAHTTASK